jgi:predicted dehydrogenase
MSGVIGDVSRSISNGSWTRSTGRTISAAGTGQEELGRLVRAQATHHFDLVNWWLDTEPLQVYAQGGLFFYGRENAEKRGVTEFYDRGTGNPVAAADPFSLDLAKDDKLRKMYLEAEKHDGYRRDQSVFGDCISIEDDMSAIVNYKSGAVMSYHLTAYSPWEGYRIAFNGTKGPGSRSRGEILRVGSAKDQNQPELRDGKAVELDEKARILVRPHWGKPSEIIIDGGKDAGHGGGDIRLLRDVLIGTDADPLGRAADHEAGTRSIMVGIAANRSLATGLPVRIADLLNPDRFPKPDNTWCRFDKGSILSFISEPE